MIGPVSMLTIGIYGFHAVGFIEKLRTAHADVVVDIRARRGVRGPVYAWANAGRLQQLLQEASIGYVHLAQFSPTQVIRDLQKVDDDLRGISKRGRDVLSVSFAAAYREKILTGSVGVRFVESLEPGATRPALLCVERSPAACHRSLLAERVGADLGLEVTDLLP